MHYITYNLNRNTWVISTLAIDKLLDHNLRHNMCMRPPLQIVLILNSCEAFTQISISQQNVKLSCKSVHLGISTWSLISWSTFIHALKWEN